MGMMGDIYCGAKAKIFGFDLESYGKCKESFKDEAPEESIFGGEEASSTDSSDSLWQNPQTVVDDVKADRPDVYSDDNWGNAARNALDSHVDW